MKRTVSIAGLAAMVLASSGAYAYEQYSENDDATYCRACHGDFRSSNYTSEVDGQDWGNLHNVHRQMMLSGDCDTCHGANNLPVMIASSAGGNGLEALSCMGCHGRAEDNVAGNPESPNGYGAGLRQHHDVSGVTICRGCHGDASPDNYTPVGEDVLPPYYADPGNGHAAMPTNSCNADQSEQFAGAAIGLDNDGDGDVDGLDSDCGAAGGAGGALGTAGAAGAVSVPGQAGTAGMLNAGGATSSGGVSSTAGTAGASVATGGETTVGGAAQGIAGAGGGEATNGGAQATGGDTSVGVAGDSQGGARSGGTAGSDRGTAGAPMATGGRDGTGGASPDGTGGAGNASNRGGAAGEVVTSRGSDDDGGCGCRQAGRAPASPSRLVAMLGLGLLGLGRWSRRRRRAT